MSGLGIPLSARFSNLIETQRRGLELWSLGLPGYGLDQELLVYVLGGSRFQADMAIFFVS